MHLRRTPPASLFVFLGLLIPLIVVRRAVAQAPPAALTDFHQYTTVVEARLLRQHESPGGFLVADPQVMARARRGELIVEPLSPAAQPDGALLHHWRGTAFAPGATAAHFEKLLQNFRAYPQTFAPEVLEAQSQRLGNCELRATMRVRQKHVITVVMDTTYDVSFGNLDPQDGYSTSRSTSIHEINAPGTGHERAFTPVEEHGFLWNLDTWWTWQQRDGGLYLQVESVSLSRSIPTGLGWALRPYVTSVPRESLEFTLRSAIGALRTSPRS